MAKATVAPFDLKAALLSALATNNRITQYLIENVPAEAWSAKTPEGKGRSIAAMAAHIHNVRLMWLKAAGAQLPAKIEESASAKETIKALGESHEALAGLLGTALESGGQVKSFKPDAASFFAYLVAHDGHHRGQIASLARRLGHPIPASVGFGMWEWSSRAKEL